MNQINVKRINELLQYNETTGELIWNVYRGGKAKAGTVAGCFDSDSGYIKISIDDVAYRAHRVCWALFYGENPEGEIDHIDGDRANNQIKNLRLVSSSENSRNSSCRNDNKSGVTGVRFHLASNKWAAAIKTGGKEIHLGVYSDINSAIMIRKLAERAYGFHKNHGRVL